MNFQGESQEQDDNSDINDLINVGFHQKEENLSNEDTELNLKSLTRKFRDDLVVKLMED
jgi:hypothetical protein